MNIPWQDLEPDTLNNVIEYFVLREGTDYGEHERSLAEKVYDVKSQLEAGLLVIVWSDIHETLDIKIAE